jgi:hypothetical protein
MTRSNKIKSSVTISVGSETSSGTRRSAGMPPAKEVFEADIIGKKKQAEQEERELAAKKAQEVAGPRSETIACQLQQNSFHCG